MLTDEPFLENKYLLALYSRTLMLAMFYLKIGGTSKIYGWVFDMIL